MIPPPTAEDLAHNAEHDSQWDIRYPDETMLRLQSWIRRAVHAEAELAAAKAEVERLNKDAAYTIRLAQDIEAKWPAHKAALAAAQQREAGLREALKAIKTCHTVSGIWEIATAALAASEPPAAAQIIYCKGCHAVLHDQAAADGFCGDCEPPRPERPCEHCGKPKPLVAPTCPQCGEIDLDVDPPPLPKMVGEPPQGEGRMP